MISLKQTHLFSANFSESLKLVLDDNMDEESESVAKGQPQGAA